VLDRFPQLRFVAVHGGGLLPYQAGRFDNDFCEARGKADRPRHPSEILASFYYDTVLMTKTAIRFLIDYAGPDRVMVGSDFGAAPAERGAVSVSGAVVAAQADPAVTAAILHGTAERVFGLDLHC
jgi:aminocarboxymuconate-semialdehyde decarboxylase